MSKLLSLFYYFFNLFLYFLSKVIPKKKNVWIFGSWFGDKYLDNSKYLFEYISEYKKDIKAIWISNNDNIINFIRQQGYFAYKKYSFFAIYYGLIANYSIFVQSNLSDVMPFLNNGKTKLVQLWHGIPLKKIGSDDKIYTNPNIDKNNKYRIKKFLFPFWFDEHYHFIFSSSEQDKFNFINAFNNKNVIVAGYPRNDILYPNLNNNLTNIVYLPTFRDKINSKIDLFSDYQFDFYKWSNFLSDKGMKLYIKMHPVNKPSDLVIKMMSNSSNIIFLSDEVDVTSFLNNTDILITDYSSVFFDFLLTDKPIVFSPFDYYEYLVKDREFYYDYEKITPGPKCNDWDEVLTWVINFRDNPKLFYHERQNVKDHFHTYKDSNSRSRIYRILKENL